MAPRSKAPRPTKKPAASKKPASRARRTGDEVDAELVEDGSAQSRPEGEGLLENPDAVEPSEDELEEVEADETPGLVPVPRSAPAVSRTDPLQQYMNEVNRHPLLTREEETSLARSYRATGNLDAAYRLVASNLRLVVKLAHEYHRNPLSLLDLIQEGNIGLMQAVKKFDPDRGVKLSSYAAWWIRAYILRYIMENWKMVKLGTTEAQRKLFFKLRQEQDKLTSQGFEVTPKLLADRLNVTEQDVIEMDQRLGHDELSLDAPLGDEEKTTRADRLLPDRGVAADERLGNEELKALFHQKLQVFAKTLNEKERYIFEKRLVADDPLTLQDIGTHFGVSRERARQIEAALIARMREYVKAEIPDFDLMAAPKD
jgi:RNA polymerase sigma-32 factor